MADALDSSLKPTKSEPSPDSESTHERILDVAERLFASKGLAGTAVRDIARDAGLTAPSLYNHFDGKQALYEAVLTRGVQPLFDLIAGLETAMPDDPRSGDLLDGIVDHFAERPDIAKLIQHESLTGGASLSRIVHGWLRPIVSAGLVAMENNHDSVWNEEERPLAVAAWIHVIVGHFASAPLIEELFEIDPLSPEQLERQKKFLRRFADIMISRA
jgi:TetR/AcrR family transcriptional regulator